MPGLGIRGSRRVQGSLQAARAAWSIRRDTSPALPSARCVNAAGPGSYDTGPRLPPRPVTAMCDVKSTVLEEAFHEEP